MPRIKLTKPVEYHGVTHPAGTVFDADIDRRDVARVIAGHGETIDIPHSSYERDVRRHSLLPFKVAQTFVENSPPTWNIYTPRNGKRFNGDCVAVCDNRDDAEFIVRACNAYDDLLAALKSFMRAPSIGSSGPGSVTIEVQTFNIEAAEKAIAAAEGKCEMCRGLGKIEYGTGLPLSKCPQCGGKTDA